MRICYITTQARSVDGWGRYSVEAIKSVRAQGVEPVLITSQPEVDDSLADVTHLPILPELFKGRGTTLRTLLLSGQVKAITANCDAIHVLAEPYAPLGAAAKSGKPLFTAAHGTWAVRPFDRTASKAVFSWAYRRATKVICLSRYTCQRLHAVLPKLDSVTLTAGVYPAEYEQPADRSLLPSWVGLVPVLFGAGALKARKGYHVSLEAFAIAQEKIPDLKYVIAGSHTDAPQYVEQLQQRIEDLHLGDAVHLLGKVSFAELKAWYRYSDVFILTPVNQGNSFEGLGLVYLEAGASGTPSVGTLNCGAQEAIADGKTGLLVPQNDPEATADAIIGLVGRPDVIERMGQAAHARAHELSWARFAEQLVTLYQQHI